MATKTSPRRVLITGGCGEIGSLLVKALSNQYALTLLDKNSPPRPPGVPFIHADIATTRPEQLVSWFHNQEIIIHLAADRNDDADWESLLANNINGTANVCQAASEAQCCRVILASSLQVVTGYPKKTFVHTEMPGNPESLYGASKAWGEIIGRYYSQEKNLSVLCLRIGRLKQASKINRRTYHLERVITQRDLVHLIECCLQAPETLRYGVFHGTSNNRIQQFDLRKSREILGYHPQDDAFKLAEQNYIAELCHWLKKTALGLIRKTS